MVGAASGLWTIWILCRTWWKKVVGVDHSDYLPVLWEGAVSAVPCRDSILINLSRFFQKSEKASKNLDSFGPPLRFTF